MKENWDNSNLWRKNKNKIIVLRLIHKTRHFYHHAVNLPCRKFKKNSRDKRIRPSMIFFGHSFEMFLKALFLIIFTIKTSGYMKFRSINFYYFDNPFWWGMGKNGSKRSRMVSFSLSVGGGSIFISLSKFRALSAQV